MVKLAVIGGSEFIVGFQLAGVKGTLEVTGNYFNEMGKFRDKKDYGIVIVDEKMMASLDSYQKQIIESSVDPVFIPVSAGVEQDSLKKLIKKSIGVDLWK